MRDFLSRGIDISQPEAAAVVADLDRMHQAMSRVGLAPSDKRFAAVFEHTGDSRRSAASAAADAVTAGADAVGRAVASARAINPHLNCFLEIFEEAKGTDRPTTASSDRPLQGMPFAYKDAFATERRMATVGVGAGYGWQAPQRSAIVRRMTEAGAVAIGALNLDPHCYTATGLNPYFGRTLNPHGLNFAIGGSSSGAAAAVAAGVVPVALGTDTGGSVRIPASLCGVFGFKPSYGVLTDTGMAPLSRSQDTAGILAADMATLMAVFDVLTGHAAGTRDEPTATAAGSTLQGADPTALRIGIDRAGLWTGADDDVHDIIAAAVEDLKRRGVKVVDIAFPSVDDLNTCASIVTGFEAAGEHAATLAKAKKWYPPAVRRRLLTAAGIAEADYRQAVRLRPAFLDRVLRDCFDRADLIAFPTLRTRAADVSGIGDDDIERAGALNLEFLRLNRPISYLGLPAISVPVGTDRNNIPIGLQLVAPPHHDNRLLQFVWWAFNGAGRIAPPGIA